METRRLFLNRLDPLHEPLDVAVVIDVLRSFSTAAYAFAAGVPAIYPVETIAEAWRLRERFPDALLTGAIGGGDPIPGFDFGNSPSMFLHRPLAGHPLIQSTAAGVRGLTRFSHARALFAASAVCARATASAIRALAPATVSFIITGEWVDRDGDEDIACADYLEALLLDTPADTGRIEQRIRDSDFGRRFQRGDNPNLPRSDLDLCARADRFEFAIPVRREDGLLVLRPEIPGSTPGKTPRQAGR